jgi:hypothetical protein
MTDHNVTEHDDRLTWVCLAALAIIAVFIFIVSSAP